MSNYNAYHILLSNTSIFYFFLIFSILVIFLLYRKKYFTILDPLFIGLISSMFSIPVFLTLYINGYIANDDFISFICSELFLFLGLALSFRINLKQFFTNNYINNYLVEFNVKKNSLIFFYTFFSIYILTQFIVYRVSGVPLFNKSRLDDFSGGSGYGFFSRVIEITIFFSLFFYFLFVFTRRFNLLKFFIPTFFFIVICFNLFLTGSKSAFLIIFQILLVASIVIKSNGINNNVFKKVFKYKTLFLVLMILGIVFLFYIIDKISSVSNRTFFESLILRFIHFGDIYWYAYPNKAYLTTRGGNWFMAIFTDTLGFLKLIPWHKMPTHIGYKLYQIFHPSLNIQGANARFNVFGVVYFGHIGLVIYSFIIGVVLGSLRRLIFTKTNSIFLICIFAFIFVKSYTIFVDITLFITSMNNIIFVFPLFYLIGLINTKFFSK